MTTFAGVKAHKIILIHILVEDSAIFKPRVKQKG